MAEDWLIVLRILRTMMVLHSPVRWSDEIAQVDRRISRLERDP